LAEVASDPAESPRIEQLVDDLFRDYRINQHRSLDDVQTRWRLHLMPFFGSVPATELDSRLLARYIDKRREQHASNASINRELACLKRMYRLAYLLTPPRVATSLLKRHTVEVASSRVILYNTKYIVTRK
jgi:hypothetical protein